MVIKDYLCRKKQMTVFEYDSTAIATLRPTTLRPTTLRPTT